MFRYPDQAGIILGSNSPQFPASGTGDLHPNHINDADVDGEDENDDEDEEDYTDEMPNTTSYKRDKKRGSICAEIVQENQDDVREFEKTPEERMRILEILEYSPPRRTL